jgi:hypothetical protein
VGLWLLGLWLAWPYWWAEHQRRPGQPPAAPAAPPPICAGGFIPPFGPQAPRNRLIHIYPARRVPPPQARTIPGARLPWVLHRYRNTECPPVFVAGLANAQYHAPAHDLFDAGGELLPEFSFFGPENRLAESREYVRRYPHGLPPAERWPGVTAALAAHYAEWNYYHWMLQVLPRLEVLRLAGITPQQVDRYLLNAPHFPFHTETLAQLGLPLEKVAPAGPETHFSADYLWTTSSLRFNAHQQSWVHQFLRREFLPPGAASGGAERLYISRGNATRRLIVNEAELAARLEALGFCTVVPDRLTVAQQAAAFAAARVIVAPHGAGLTNLVFARPGSQVLELLSPARRAMHYWELSNACGLEYYYLIGEDRRGAQDAEALRVPLGRLNALLEIAGVR